MLAALRPTHFKAVVLNHRRTHFNASSTSSTADLTSQLINRRTVTLQEEAWFKALESGQFWSTSFPHNTYITVQTHISGVDHSCYVIDAKHGLVDAERWEALLCCYGVA